ncbi:MAG: hypothetical protein ACFBSC_17045 [Microcoleaceae cyanobacterium]
MTQALAVRPQSEPLSQQRPAVSVWLDPVALRAAKQLYLSYLQIHARQMRRPLGVAIDPATCRGILLFSKRAVLLPGESFIPFEQLEAEIY